MPWRSAPRLFFSTLASLHSSQLTVSKPGVRTLPLFPILIVTIVLLYRIGEMLAQSINESRFQVRQELALHVNPSQFHPIGECICTTIIAGTWAWVVTCSFSLGRHVMA